MKRVVAGCTATIMLLAVLFAPDLSWSARWHRTVRRLLAKAEARVAIWRGQPTRLVSIVGRLNGYGAQIEALRGARVIADETTSGYSASSDGDGRFVLPHVMWFPGASYRLTVAADEYHFRQFTVEAPSTFPDNDIVNVGELQFDDGRESSRQDSAVRYMEYDKGNDEFYRGLFDRLAAPSQTEDEKIDAINKYVASKLNHQETAASFRSPRQILERGSGYCSNLALAMAAITEAGGYPTRTVHMSDSPEHRNTHVVVEVYYGDHWHLYDPTYGVFFLNREGAVASYRQLRLDTGLITGKAFQGFKPSAIEDMLAWMPRTYGAGFHQIYQSDKRDLCDAW